MWLDVTSINSSKVRDRVLHDLRTSDEITNNGCQLSNVLCCLISSMFDMKMASGQLIYILEVVI